jgi:hypothetical protein
VINRRWRPVPAAVYVYGAARATSPHLPHREGRLGGFTVPELTGRVWTARDLNPSEDTIRSAAIAAVVSGRAQDLTLEPGADCELAAAGALPPLRFHCSARVTFGPLLV